MKQPKQASSGFTIVELLIVVVVIAILAAITIVSYNGVMARARATAVTSFLRSTDEAFRLAAMEEDRTTWWSDKDFTGANNPLIEEVIANSSVGNYLKSAQGLRTNYDNDLDVYGDPSSCMPSYTNAGDDAYWRGALVFVGDLSDDIVKRVDATLDDGNPLCGRVRYGNTYKNGLVYQLGFDQEIK